MPNFFINVKEKGAKKAAGNIGAVTSSMKRMAIQAASVAVVMQGVKKSIQLSAEMEGVKRGFDNLAKSAGFSSSAFQKFKSATDGTIDSLTLMKKANAAMLLGITDSEDQMAQMFDVAQRLGQSLGIDTVQSIDSLVTGMGRQCLTSDSFISTKDGIKQIIDIKEGDIVLSYKEGKIIETEVTHLHNNGIHQTYIVTFKDGKYIKSTDNHRYLTNNGWKYLSELGGGSKILNIDDEYSEIHSINSFGEEEVYDLTVPETANFFANGLCVHNSKLMLDNLGIMVDTNKSYKVYAESVGKSVSQLTDQERKTAFVNAAMAEANFLVAQLGEEELTTKDAMAQVATAAADVAVSLGDLLGPTVIRAAELFVGAAEAVDRYLFTLKSLDQKTIQGEQDQLKLVAAINTTKKEIYELNSATIDIGANFGTMNQATQAEREEMERLVIQLSSLETQLNNVNMLLVDMPAPSVLALGPVIDENAVALEAYALKQQASLDNYNLEQELIASLIEKYPELANSVGLVTDAETKAIKASELLSKQKETARKNLLSGMGAALGQSREFAKAQGRIAQAQAVMDTWASANKAMREGGPFPINLLSAAGVVAMGLANVQKIEDSIRSAATGADFITSGPQMMMVGDNPGGQERVSVTPLSSPAGIDAPVSGAITLNISAPLVDDTVVDSIIPAIREAVRRGEMLVD